MALILLTVTDGPVEVAAVVSHQRAEDIGHAQKHRPHCAQLQPCQLNVSSLSVSIPHSLNVNPNQPA